ncbi:hypothetical protein QO003_000623 [Arthrobacter silviterrae]|uniref:Right-handed parallel beta-helix repeat-containing protein n=1 Tax=Arthrobacter silviterrae TaxID=2026658 RepID=A0ABX0D6J1_9MICC|nr:hypothetical protein [Arthrobacter silviterrae]MDQ0276320.1 hypothetical protein [Arthrobacter silviterrae]NGN82499.1 hypothetical protein [Arthrobacter silviterrae]
MGRTQVTSAGALTQALASGAANIEVIGRLKGMPSVTLPPGTKLRGGELTFGAKGLRLTSDNTVQDTTITTSPHEVAIYNDTSVPDLGTLALANVTTTGQVYLAADNNVRAGRIEADGVHVTAADTRGRFHRPTGFGVEALQGAFTVWNRQADAAVRLTARLERISAGSAAEPVHGSGVFVGGHGDTAGKADGGTIDVELLSTVDVFSNGGIAPGTPDLISGGVFVISGANVAEVRNLGTTTTYGQNDMVLDNWGAVTAWNARGAVTSWGPSGIGFVNFGDIGVLTVDAPVETYGLGARGFNVYDGSLREAVFDSITTHGDGSVGVQVSRDLPALTIRGDLRTEGGMGESLVKGVLLPLSAIALSIKPGGRIGTASIGGNVRTEGAGVPAMELEGELDSITVGGKVTAAGDASDVVRAVPALAAAIAGLTMEGR